MVLLLCNISRSFPFLRTEAERKEAAERQKWEDELRSQYEKLVLDVMGIFRKIESMCLIEDSYDDRYWLNENVRILREKAGRKLHLSALARLDGIKAEYETPEEFEHDYIAAEELARSILIIPPCTKTPPTMRPTTTTTTTTTMTRKSRMNRFGLGNVVRDLRIWALLHDQLTSLTQCPDASIIFWDHSGTTTLANVIAKVDLWRVIHSLKARHIVKQVSDTVSLIRDQTFTFRERWTEFIDRRPLTF